VNRTTREELAPAAAVDSLLERSAVNYRRRSRRNRSPARTLTFELVSLLVHRANESSCCHRELA
jgi:hypothetical protein